MVDLPTNKAGEPIVLCERRGHIAVVRMNRPESRNAMSDELKAALIQVWDAQEADPDIWVHVISGVGERSFCAGADLKAMGRNRAGQDPAAAIGFGGVTPLLKKPIIAAVSGFALGGGCELCLACDLIVAEEHAEFGLPEIRRGIVAGAGGLERLPRRIPPTVALEVILTGLPLTAQRAYELGLVNRVVPTGQGVQAAVELATAICDAAPYAVRYSKAVARAAFSLGEASARTTAAELRDEWLASPDRKEGLAAFVEKRKPIWLGYLD